MASLIRPARTTDLDALVALLAILFGIEEDFDIDPDCQRRGLELMLAHEDAVVFVAESDSRVVGMASGQLTISTAEGAVALLVEDVVVANEWRGQGLGRELLQGLEEWAQTRQVSRMQLLADRNNKPAFTFYKTLAWQPTELVCLRKRLPAHEFSGD